jgi:hypothetical protein
VWNINAVEPVALEYSRHNYNATDFYESGPYRSSDHDPLVVGLDLPTGPVPTRTTGSVTPDPVTRKQDRPVVRVEVSPRDGGADAPVIEEGTVLVRERGRVLGWGAVSDGVATVTLPAYHRSGRHWLEVRYLGTEHAAPSGDWVSFTVERSGHHPRR